MYKYETHLHTSPVSKCASSTVRETLDFYKKIGYDGIFITNHFLDGNINIDKTCSYEEKINFYFSDYEEAQMLSKEIGIKVFLGVEMSYGGTDFLVYGLDKEWFLEHPEITEMKKSVELPYLREHGAFIIQAHPFRVASYIDHIRLFPACIDGVEVINACNTEFENKMAGLYAENYGLIKSAGSDNHTGQKMTKLAGISTDVPLNSVSDFIECLKSGNHTVFAVDNTIEEI